MRSTPAHPATSLVLLACTALHLAPALASAQTRPSGLPPATSLAPPNRSAPNPKPTPAVPPPTSPLFTEALADLPLITAQSVEDAVREGIERNRLVIIFWSDTPAPPESPAWRFRPCLNSPSLRAYIKWHAVTAATANPPSWIQRQVWPELRRKHEELPAAVIIQGREVVRVIGRPNLPSLGGAMTRGLDQRFENDGRFYPRPVRILGETDIAMDAIAARDPVWFENHNRLNPPPEPPPTRRPFSEGFDDLAPIVRDPELGDKTTVLDRLELARALLRSGDLHNATGLYSWLFERGEVLDPAFRAARLSVLAPDIAELTRRRSEAMRRFDAIRKDRISRLAWADHPALHEFFVLSSATGNQVDVLDYLDMFVNDPDESTSLPPADAAAYSLLARRTDYALGYELPAEPLQRVAAIVQRLERPLPKSTLEKDREAFQSFARQYLIDEGARIYTSLLRKGDDVSAAQAARIILTSSDTPETRLALITTALAADPPQPRLAHLRWLEEAEAALSKPRPDLRARLQSALTSGPTQPETPARP